MASGASGSHRAGQVAFQIQVDGVWNVAGLELCRAGGWVLEVEAAVEQPHSLRLQRRERLGRNQRAEVGRPHTTASTAARSVVTI